MDVSAASAASAISTYQYQAAVQSSGQSKAVLQTLAQAYASSSASSSTDPLSALVGSSNLSPLVSAIYSQSAASGSSSALSGLTSQRVGGLDSGAATSLLASLSTDSSGLDGFDAALGGSTALALSAYQAKQTAASNAAKAPAADADSATVTAYVQQVLQTSQAATQTATFNLLG